MTVAAQIAQKMVRTKKLFVIIFLNFLKNPLFLMLPILPVRTESDDRLIRFKLLLLSMLIFKFLQ